MTAPVGRVAVLASCADYGTRSITAAFERLLEPESVLHLDKGFKRMGPARFLAAWRFLHRQSRAGIPVLCLFNAPVLLGGLLPLPKTRRCSGILDWTETYPALRTGAIMRAYDRVYVRAFRHIGGVFSPSPGFIEYFRAKGSAIKPCLYPLPSVKRPKIPKRSDRSIRILFIGADYRRKGGDTLLELWKKHRPAGASLTFVAPSPPTAQMDGVNFQTGVRAGTPEHGELLSSHDLFVLPTRLEPFGYSLMEAISHGLCPVTTRAAGAAGIVAQAGGIVCQSPEEAILAAFNLCESPDELLSRRESCARFVPSYEKQARDSIKAVLWGDSAADAIRTKPT
jgi:glycosyltransferase involved in cell wall biosynthesis